MFDTFQSWAIGLAAVLDTALLVVLLERRNRPFARTPIVILLLGAWLFHVGALALIVIGPIPGSWADRVQRGCLLAMAAGVLLKTSGMLHAAVRVWRTGLDPRRRANLWHAVLYAPLLMILPLAFTIESPAPERWIAPLLSWAPVYLVWSTLVNLLAAMVFLRVRSRIDLPGVGPFFLATAIILLVQIALNAFVFAHARTAWPEWEAQLLFACGLPSIAMTLLFAYFSIRFNFLRLVMERAVVYGTILAGIVLCHQFVFQEASLALPRTFRLPLVLLEGAVVLLLVSFYRPLRDRLARAVRSLMGAPVAETRDRLRAMSIGLSAQAGSSTDQILHWFAAELRSALDVDFVAGWLFQPAGEIQARFGDSRRISDNHALIMLRHMSANEILIAFPPYAIGDGVLEAMQSAGVSLAVTKPNANAVGLLFVGKHQRSRELDDEEANAVVLLVELLAVTLENSRLLSDRLAAERRIGHAEKLSALGLMASSIAHEIKNPLSAIKTIATVLAEDLGPESAHLEDVAMIRGEIDRLTITTQQLLDFVKPVCRGLEDENFVPIGRVVLSATEILRRLARERGINIKTDIPDDLPSIRAEESTLREIVFNLMSNSIEAIGDGGLVEVICARINGHVTTTIRDNGPGIPTEFRERMFEPFVTTRGKGTGLGLYVVRRRVDELGGKIDCESDSSGTSFVVTIPTP